MPSVTARIKRTGEEGEIEENETPKKKKATWGQKADFSDNTEEASVTAVGRAAA